nr:hypothetical protein [Tanacetum cinerariifolium]
MVHQSFLINNINAMKDTFSIKAMIVCLWRQYYYDGDTLASMDIILMDEKEEQVIVGDVVHGERKGKWNKRMAIEFQDIEHLEQVGDDTSSLQLLNLTSEALHDKSAYVLKEDEANNPNAVDYPADLNKLIRKTLLFRVDVSRYNLINNYAEVKDVNEADGDNEEKQLKN